MPDPNMELKSSIQPLMTTSKLSEMKVPNTQPKMMISSHMLMMIMHIGLVSSPQGQQSRVL